MAPPANETNPDAKEVLVPKKSANDERTYRWFRLRNGLHVLVISDPTTEKAGAAINVNIGHYSDPEYALGMAHFLEHMLFLGTKKYPEENSYSSFMKSHGGYDNAYTTFENTNYYFDVASEFLEEALDRFAQFFISPLFTESATEREMKAVDSEYQKNLQKDSWRYDQFERSKLNPSHPISKLGIGNLRTLKDIPASKGIDIRNELLEFHRKYYSANLMRLVVLGKEPLDQLEKWAIEKFEEVPSSNRDPVNVKDVPVLIPELAKKLYTLVPVGEAMEVRMSFTLPPLEAYYLKKPEDYLSHLIGHEGEGSILALLKSKGWANELISGTSRSVSDHETFEVNVKLTPVGLEHYKDIVSLVFQYIRLLKQSGFPKWIFDEVARVRQIEFQFQDMYAPSHYVTYLAANMQKYQPEHVLSGPFLVEEYDRDLIAQVCDHLSPANFRLFVVAKQFESTTDKEEEWYKIKYAEQSISEEDLKQWETSPIDPGLALPQPNEFLAEDLSLKTPGEKTPNEKLEITSPELLVEDERRQVWYKYDTVFRVPKANVYTQFITPRSYDSARSTVLSKIFVELCLDALNKFTYSATIAGLSFQYYVIPLGFVVKVKGLNDKLPHLLYKIIDQIANFSVDDARFEVIREKLQRQYLSWMLMGPYEWAKYRAGSLLSKVWSFEDTLAAISEVKPEHLRAYLPTLLSEFWLNMLVHGNIEKQEALDISKRVWSTLKAKPLPEESFPYDQIANLPEGKTLLFRETLPNKNDVNSAIYFYSQIGMEQPRESALLNLLVSIASEPCFDQLRTKEQLGYLVSSGRAIINSVHAFKVEIQSAVKDPLHLLERIESFLNQFRTVILQEMSEEMFQNYKQALYIQLIEKDVALSHETDRHWDEISSWRYAFDALKRQVEELKQLSKQDVIDFYDTYIANPAKRKRLIVQIFGNQHLKPTEPVQDPTVVEISSTTEARKSIPLYPAPDRHPKQTPSISAP